MNGAFTDYFIAGFVLFAVGVPFLRGWIPRNRLSGFRTSKTLSNDRVWYEANRVAGRDLMIAGAVVMATAVYSAATPAWSAPPCSQDGPRSGSAPAEYMSACSIHARPRSTLPGPS